MVLKYGEFTKLCLDTIAVDGLNFRIFLSGGILSKSPEKEAKKLPMNG